MGERRTLTEEGCRRAIELGVYPFVVPLRPVPGTLMAGVPPPDPDYVAAIYRSVSTMLAASGLDHDGAAAGCARCQAPDVAANGNSRNHDGQDQVDHD